MKATKKKRHPYPWLIEPLEPDPSFVDKSMFGCRATYFRGLLVLVCAANEEPWNGVLVPTDREFHASLQKDFPELNPHPVLGKWLYISQKEEGFEETVLKIVERIRVVDSRFGIEPRPRKPKAKKAFQQR